MLKFLTQKLKTQSINEGIATDNKADENHDSGTESDDEIEDPQILAPVTFLDRMFNISPADTGCSIESPASGQQDPHSSEEELEVINNLTRPLKVNCQPEKRKWSQVGDDSSCCCRCTPENEENISHYGNVTPSSPCCCIRCCGDEVTTVHIEQHSGSSDEEVHNLLASMATPVQFRTSPPIEALKLGRRTPNNRITLMSPPAKQIHFDMSPRKKSRHVRDTHMPRPFLDFEKMQKLTAHPMKTWNHSADHGGELSLFCW